MPANTTKVGAVEKRTNALWNRCWQNALLKSGYGLAFGGLTAFLLFRGPVSRSAVTCFAIGGGLGTAWMDCRVSFENPRVAEQLSVFALPSFAFNGPKSRTETDQGHTQTDSSETRQTDTTTTVERTNESPSKSSPRRDC